MDLKEFIKSKRDTLSSSSITTYASLLKNLYLNVFPKDTKMDFKRFNETDTIIAYVKDLPPNRRKTLLSALVIVTENKKYRDLMLEDIKEFNAEISKQEKTESQKQSWIEEDELKGICEQYKKHADNLFKKPKKTMSDLQDIQNYIILTLLSGEFISPRRSKDFVDFKIKNLDKEKDNYLEGNNLVFNSYKTAKTYGKQTIPIPPKLKSILKKWIGINETENLLFDTNGNKLSNVKLNQRLNKIFGKKASVNALRHTFLTEKHGDTIKKNKELEKDMKDMGSSMNMSKTYIKKDD
jgi:integrase